MGVDEFCSVPQLELTFAIDGRVLGKAQTIELTEDVYAVVADMRAMVERFSARLISAALDREFLGYDDE